MLNSKQDVRAQALFRAILGPNRKKAAYKEFSRLALMRSVPGFWNRVSVTTSSHQTKEEQWCAGDSVLKFTEAGGVGRRL